MHGGDPIDGGNAAAGQDAAQHDAPLPVARIPPELLCRIFLILSSIDKPRPSDGHSDDRGGLGWITATHDASHAITVLLPDYHLRVVPTHAELALPALERLTLDLKLLNLRAAPRPVIALANLWDLILSTTVAGAARVMESVVLPVTAGVQYFADFRGDTTADLLALFRAATACVRRHLLGTHRRALAVLASASLESLEVGCGGNDDPWPEALGRAVGLRSLTGAGSAAQRFSAAPVDFLPALTELKLRDGNCGMGADWNELALGLERRAGAGCALRVLTLAGYRLAEAQVRRLRDAVPGMELL
ncbi:hypothetical protein FA95DRAFT_1679857 [Auriscalpium vulgare]|uniref:Uncharacterized protein n=1 Tax=Auriscalpium vulgare TaxID=40419 RepID=A0ACB8RQ39_9AGAM|nr:hypothetical protein FA95DRAFT_1679857 [Auriscalpium vulgare]